MIDEKCGNIEYTPLYNFEGELTSELDTRKYMTSGEGYLYKEEENYTFT